jgi:hypothetical protein
MRSDGDLGGISAVDPERLARWAAREPGVNKADARGLLEALAEEAQRILDVRIARRGLRARAIPGTKSGWLVYARGRDWVELAWRLTTGGSEMVELLVSPSDTEPPDSRLLVEVWFKPRRTQGVLARPTDDRPRGGFRFDEAYLSWCRRFRVPAAGSAQDVQASVLKAWRTSIAALERTGAFDGLRTP